LRAPAQHAVLAFAGDVRTLRALHGTEPPATVVNRVLALRGHGVTHLADALRAASRQLAVARAQRQVVVLLSDCRHTDEDPAAAARLLPELVVLAPRRRGAGRGVRQAAGPVALPGSLADVPAVLNQLLASKSTSHNAAVDRYRPGL
jgi:hypothetical protein